MEMRVLNALLTSGWAWLCVVKAQTHNVDVRVQPTVCCLGFMVCMLCGMRMQPLIHVRLTEHLTCELGCAACTQHTDDVRARHTVRRLGLMCMMHCRAYGNILNILNIIYVSRRTCACERGHVRAAIVMSRSGVVSRSHRDPTPAARHVRGRAFMLRLDLSLMHAACMHADAPHVDGHAGAMWQVWHPTRHTANVREWAFVPTSTNPKHGQCAAGMMACCMCAYACAWARLC